MTRTGEPGIDALIELFMATPVPLGFAMTEPSMAIRVLKSADYSKGRCVEVARAFTDFVLSHSEYQAQTASGDPNDWGYHDRPDRGFMTHSVTHVTGRDHQYMIDFTATQYGYSEHPMVQRRNGNGRWERKW